MPVSPDFLPWYPVIHTKRKIAQLSDNLATFQNGGAGRNRTYYQVVMSRLL